MTPKLQIFRSVTGRVEAQPEIKLKAKSRMPWRGGRALNGIGSDHKIVVRRFEVGSNPVPRLLTLPCTIAKAQSASLILLS